MMFHVRLIYFEHAKVEIFLLIHKNCIFPLLKRKKLYPHKPKNAIFCLYLRKYLLKQHYYGKNTCIT